MKLGAKSTDFGAKLNENFSGCLINPKIDGGKRSKIGAYQWV